MKRIAPHLVIFTLALFYLAFCLFTYKDYGITADEELNYANGRKILEYFKTPTTIKSVSSTINNPKNTPLLDTHNRLYPAFTSIFNSKGYYEWYHLINLVFALSIFCALYYLIYFKYKKVSYAVCSVLALFLLPRFMGHIPANPKDVPFAIFYFLSIIAIYKFPGNKTAFMLLILGILFGITQSMRTVGFTLYPIYILYTLYNKKPLKDTFLDLLLVFLVAGFINASTWAFVGANYFRNTIELFRNASDFAPWTNTMLFQGEFLSKYERPQSYLLIWFLFTTPIYVLISSLLSFVYLKKSKLLFLTWVTILINIFLYFAVKPVIYNGLRHFLYLLPLILLTSLISVFETLNNKVVGKHLKAMIVMFVLVNLSAVAYSMIRLHPYEYIYFNEIAGGLNGAAGKYEMDYWGASYKEAAEWLRDQPYSKVYPCNVSYVMQYYSHGKYEVVGSSHEAEYVVCDYETELKEKYSGETVFEVKRFGIPINIVRKVNPAKSN